MYPFVNGAVIKTEALQTVSQFIFKLIDFFL